MRFMLALFLCLIVTPAFSAMECNTTPESEIQKAIADDPSRLVRVLKGDDLQTFFANMSNRGYLIGQLDKVDAVYIVDAGKLTGYNEDNVWLFFVFDSCLIKAIPASKSVIMEMLP